MTTYCRKATVSEDGKSVEVVASGRSFNCFPSKFSIGGWSVEIHPNHFVTAPSLWAALDLAIDKYNRSEARA